MNSSLPQSPDPAAPPASVEHPPWCFIVDDHYDSDCGTHHIGQPRIIAGYGENSGMQRPMPIKVRAEWYDPVPEHSEETRGQFPPEVEAPMVVLDPSLEPYVSFTPRQARELAAALIGIADELEPNRYPTGREPDS